MSRKVKCGGERNGRGKRKKREEMIRRQNKRKRERERRKSETGFYVNYNYLIDELINKRINYI